MTKVFITDYINNPNIEKKILGNNLSSKKNKLAEVLLVWHENINQEYCSYFKNLKGVIRYGVGYDNIDLEYLNKNKIIFCNTPDYGIDEVSSTALAGILNISRGLTQYDQMLKYMDEVDFNIWQENIIKNIKRTNKINVGIIGAGRIGSSLLRKLQVIGYNCGFYDPYVAQGYEKSLMVERYQHLDELLSNSDIISIHVPLNQSTKGMVDNNFIHKMKKGSSLINTSRGPVIKNNEILLDALQSKQLDSIFLDVLPSEPPNLNDKLIKLWKQNKNVFNGRLIINPHTSYYSRDSFAEMRIKASTNALRIINKKTPLNIIQN